MAKPWSSHGQTKEKLLLGKVKTKSSLTQGQVMTGETQILNQTIDMKLEILIPFQVRA